MENTTLELFNSTANVTNGVETDPIKIAMKQVTSVLLVAILAIIMMSLGCTIEFDKLIKQIKRPLPALIGMALQFIVYPLMVFGMAYAFHLSQYDALGMLLIGTCPGGSLSNLITFWCEGDVVLSVCMTSLSTAAAAGMMPLNLFIYSRAFTTETLQVPYKEIIIGLVLILVPVAIGMLIHWKLPRVSAVIIKIGGALGFIFILGVTAINFYLYPQMFDADWKLWVTAVLLPIFGLIVGYLGSWASCLNHAQCRTVGIEVSSQNVALCMTLIYVSFKLEVAIKIVMFPLIFAVFNVLVLVLYAIICKFVFIVQRKTTIKESESKTLQQFTTNSKESEDVI